MADGNLTQEEAEALIAMEKVRAAEEDYSYPRPGDKLTIPLTSKDKREMFLLDISRARIDLAKVSYQNRARQVVVLLRLDLAGPSHRNPDGEEIPCPHLHVYREGFGDKWAVSAPLDLFSNPKDLFATYEGFLQRCNVTERPRMQTGLF
ncbi:MAG: hypothetical protein FJW40_17830 [Acidobacteria bacterium]|nr:hypothetical protein [Acidobacteriota bacterium]